MRSVNNRLSGILGAVTLFTLFSSAVFAQSISTNYVPGTDFSKLHTYRWVAVGGGASIDQIQDQQIKAAVDKSLGAKSFTTKDADPVEFYVAYQVAMDQEKELDAGSRADPRWRSAWHLGPITCIAGDS